MELKEDIAILIQRFVDGDSSAQERRELLDWVEENEENKSLFLEHKRILDSAKMSLNQPKPLPFSVPKGQSVNFYSKALSWAAGIAAACIISFIMFFNPELQYETVASNLTEPSTHQLADGSTIQLNSLSSLEVSENFTSNRNCILTGEAYFDVMSDSLNPFSITARDVEITVLGTKFNVKEDSLNKSVSIQVTEGKVRCKSLYTGESVILTANQSAVFNNDSPEKSIIKDTLTNANHLAWFTHQLEFRESPLADVTEHLADYYGVSFQFADDSIKDYLFSARISSDKLEDIIQVLELTFALEIEQDSNQYRIGLAQ